MALSHTDTDLTGLNINKFPSKSAYLSALAQSLIGNNEICFVEGENNLSDLDDVTITSVSNGQALVYDSQNGVWKNQDIPSNFDFAPSYINVSDATSPCAVSFANTKKRCDTIIEYTDTTSADSGNLYLTISSSNWFENYIHIFSNAVDLNVFVSSVTDPAGHSTGNALIMPGTISFQAGEVCELGVMMIDLSGLTIPATSVLYGKNTLIVITHTTDLE